MAVSFRVLLGRSLVIAPLLVIALSTLIPTTDANEDWTFWCVVCGDHGASDTLANIILFVPLGLGLGLLRWRTVPAWLFGTGLSTAIELAQLMIPGRWPSIGDMVFNGVGTAVGCFLVVMAPRWLSPPTRSAPWWSLAAGGLAGLTFVMTAFMFAPSFPRTVYWGQWTPTLEGLELYDGEVLDAAVGDIPLPSRRLANSDTVRTLLLAGAPLRVTAIAGPAPPGLASIVSIAEQDNKQILLIGPDFDDLIFLHRTVSNRVSLTHPTFELEQWLVSVVPGDTLRIAVQRRDESYCVTLNARTECAGYTVGEGWSIIHNLEVFPWLPRNLVSLLWLAGVALPFGLWARPHPATWAGGVITLLALGLTPFVTGLLLVTPAYQWFAVLAGVAFGMAVAGSWRERRNKKQ